MDEISTKELFRRRTLKSYVESDAVAWARGQLNQSGVNPSVVGLATLSLPLNHFEVEQLLERSLRELGISEPSADEVLDDLAYEVLSSVLDGRTSAQDTCFILFNVWCKHEHRRDLYPFYLLHYAWDDLKTEPVQFYWDGVTKENFVPTVKEQASKWLEYWRANKSLKPTNPAQSDR